MNAASPYALYLGRLSPNSQRSITSQLKSIAQLLNWSPEDAQERFHQIDYRQASHIKALLVKQDWSARSINRAMIAIRGIVKTAVLSGLVPEMQSIQLQAIGKVKHGEHQGNALSPKQVDALFKQLEHERSEIGLRNLCIFALLLGTGLRRSELIALRISDYAPEKHTLHIAKGKGNKSRTVFLPVWTEAYLKTWLQCRGDESGPLINRVYRSGRIAKDKAVTDSGIYALTRKMLRLIGVEGVSPHDLRRTFITRLLQQNVDLNTVRQMAGHADISTTIMYDKRDHEVMQQAAAKLSYSRRGRK
ncbi:tyrosine-type recombinase/integrase [Bowmanella pacifica]|uniref:Integrase n=1 Tax=Bowmanella pacifica TaxID=502051 RepID=A0A917YV76_9ALTE|nr:site-specific integrase [Bowmanella pacifica]GGO65346.1 integrase [Bowmanella pacifica]